MAFRRPRSALASLLGRGDGAASSRSTQSTRSLSTGSATTNGKHVATGGSHDVLSVHETQPSLFYFAVYQVDGAVSMETSGSSSPIVKLSASLGTESTTTTSSSPSPPPNDDERADRANRAEDTREAERILCFYPPTFDRNDQLRQIGLARALANFSRNFDRMGGRIEHARNEPTRSGIENVHSQKHRMVFFEPEPGYGMLLNVNLGCIIQTVRVSGGMNTAGAAGQRTIVEFLDSSVSDAPLHEVLVSGYECFRLLHGSFAHIVRNHGGKVEELRQRLEAFYTRYLESSLELDRPFTFQQTLNGLPYLPLEHSPYMDMFALMQRVKSRPGNRVDHFLILNDQSVLWSDLEPNDTRRVQQYFTELHFARDLLPNLAGMSMGGAGSPAARTKARDGFLTLPRNLSPRSSIEPLTLFLGKDEVPHHCIIYRTGRCLTLLMARKTAASEKELALASFYESLEEALRTDLATIARAVDVQTSATPLVKTKQKQQQSRYIFFDSINVEVRTVGELPGKTLQMNAEITTALNDLRSTWKDSAEVAVKLAGDVWVAVRRFGADCEKELYVIVARKDASLADVEEEMLKICATDFKELKVR